MRLAPLVLIFTLAGDLGIGIGLEGCVRPSRPRMDSFGIAPQGDRIVFTASGEGDSDLYVLDLRSSKVRLVARTREHEATPAFAADGAHVLFTAGLANAPSHVFTSALSGANRRQLTAERAASDITPSYSPNGSVIAFARAALHRPYSMGGWTWDDWDVYVMKTDGTALRRLTRSQYYGIHGPAFSPDGRRLVYAAPPPGQTKDAVFVVQANGREQARKLIGGSSTFSDPVYATDGKHIAFVSDRGDPYDYEVWQVDADGSHPTQLTHGARYAFSLRYAPDGKSILFLADPERKDRYGLWRVNAAGGSMEKIAGPELFYDPLHWKP